MVQLDKLKASPVWARATPYLAFIVLTQLQAMSDGPMRFWLYPAKTLVAGWLLWEFRREIAEMRWNFSWEGIAAGVVGVVMWIHLDDLARLVNLPPTMLKLGKPPEPGTEWNPFVQFGEGALLAWFFVLVRTLGSSVVVPPMEEVMYRSLVWRWLANQDFLKVPLGLWRPFPILLSSAVFAFTHHEVVAAFLYALLMHALVWRKGRLGDAIVAHAVTNFLLALWVVFRPEWRFW